MKNYLILFFAFSMIVHLNAQIDQNFYFGKNIQTNKAIPEPGTISGHPYGEWHFSHDQLIQYYKTLAEKSDRMQLIQTGETYEGRPLMLAYISTPENLAKIEDIRKEHIDFISSKSAKSVNDQFNVVWLGYGVHGNESSGPNAGMLTAYYLTASNEQEINELLKQTIIIIDPSLNPDGFNRAASWVNINQSEVWIADQNNAQFSENWPGGRTNHYWFDLNRDWLLAQHLESKARLTYYHLWRPTVLTDHHEMGNNGTFFFQPGVPSRNNPYTPEKNYNLTKLISTYHASAMDEIGSLYYAEEGFDDFYYGKGSSYPDATGSIGILFEQARVNGQIINNTHGTITFAEAIRNQFTVSMSTLKAATENKIALLNYQKQFASDAISLSKSDPVKAYAFGDADKVKMTYFLDLLNLHQIEFFSNKKTVNINGTNYQSGEAYLVPLAQSQYRLIKSIFEKKTSFKDSIFYDVSTWTIPLAFNINYTELKKYDDVIDERIIDSIFPKSELVGSETKIGYLFKWNNYLAPKLLNNLLEKEILVKAATKPFTTKISNVSMPFSYGTIFIPITHQKIKAAELKNVLMDLAMQNGIDLYAIEEGINSGIDMGSSSFVPLNLPKTMMLIGNGLDSRNAGEIWHLLDYKYNFGLVRVDVDRISRINLFEYNTLIMPGGRYDLDEKFIEKLKIWVDEGGTIIAFGNANQYLADQKLIKLSIKKQKEESKNNRQPYAEAEDTRRGNSLSGVIMKAEIDISHPVAYGYESNTIPVFKNSIFSVEKSEDGYSTPLYISDNALLSGYLTAKNKLQIENSAYVLSFSKGEGSVISFIDNPNFRAYWLGTNKLVMNAIVFRELIR